MCRTVDRARCSVSRLYARRWAEMRYGYVRQLLPLQTKREDRDGCVHRFRIGCIRNVTAILFQ